LQHWQWVIVPPPATHPYIFEEVYDFKPTRRMTQV